jgi:hypothetical protein
MASSVPRAERPQPTAGTATSSPSASAILPSPNAAAESCRTVGRTSGIELVTLSVASAIPKPGHIAVGLKPTGPNRSMNAFIVPTRTGSAAFPAAIIEERSSRPRSSGLTFRTQRS